MEEKKEDTYSILEKIRTGYNAKLSIRVADFEVTVRIIPAIEQCRILEKVDAKIYSRPKPHSSDRSLDTQKAVDYQIAILKAATTLGTEKMVTDRFWESLPASVLANAFDRYDCVLKQIDPEFEKIDTEKIVQMIDDVKKKKTTWKDYFSSDLAEMGRFFLGTLSQVDNEPGS